MIADATLGHCDAVKGSYPFWISAADIMVFNMFVGNFDKFEKKIKNLVFKMLAHLVFNMFLQISAEKWGALW